jgi:thioredoxin 2
LPERLPIFASWLEHQDPNIMADAEHIVCPKCSKINRVARYRLVEGPKCGACGETLFSGHPLTVDEKAFARHMSANTIPVLTDVWAPWCGPCRMMGPMFERAAEHLEPRARLLKLNLDEAPNIARRFGIQSVPTLLLTGGGQLIGQTAGAMDSRAIIDWAQKQFPPASLH